MRFTFLFFCAFIRATFVATFVFCLHISAPTTVNLFCHCAVKADEASSNDTVFVLVSPLCSLLFSLLLYSCPCPSSTRIQLMCFDTHIVSFCAAASGAGAELGRVVRALQGGAQGVPSSVSLSLSISLFPYLPHSTQRVCGISACIKRSRHLFASML